MSDRVKSATCKHRGPITGSGPGVTFAQCRLHRQTCVVEKSQLSILSCAACGDFEPTRESPPKSSWGLGTVIETALSAVGITEERVSKLLGAPCGCSERRKKLDAISRWAAAKLGLAEFEQIERDHG